MKLLPSRPGILLMGLGTRLLWAGLVVIALWAGFYWATSASGAL